MKKRQLDNMNKATWAIREEHNLGAEVSYVVLHDCPNSNNIFGSEHIAVDVSCNKCKTDAPDFIKLAVKMGEADTINTMLAFTTPNGIGWTEPEI
jgi:hypothetical protein